jgi:hypothetical protein
MGVMCTYRDSTGFRQVPRNSPLTWLSASRINKKTNIIRFTHRSEKDSCLWAYYLGLLFCSARASSSNRVSKLNTHEDEAAELSSLPSLDYIIYIVEYVYVLK